MSNKYRVLVTGCGGDIGQSIGKILQSSTIVEEKYGLDISDKNAGKFIYSNFGIGLPVSDPDYIKFILDFVKRNSIDVIIPIAEPELRYYNQKRLDSTASGVPVIHASYKAMEVGFDKQRTITFLKEYNLPFPKTKSANNQRHGLRYPLILKARKGSGSKMVQLIKSEEKLHFLLSTIKTSDYILQEYISKEEGEYTCGLFRSREGEIRTIQFKRELTGGFSGYGEIVHNTRIERLLHDLGIHLNLIGSINVQLRLKDGVPYIFEINPRFSSTVYFRHMFGFSDLEWSLLDILGIKIPEYKLNSRLSRFYKGFVEYAD